MNVAEHLNLESVITASYTRPMLLWIMLVQWEKGKKHIMQPEHPLPNEQAKEQASITIILRENRCRRINKFKEKKVKLAEMQICSQLSTPCSTQNRYAFIEMISLIWTNELLQNPEVNELHMFLPAARCGRRNWGPLAFHCAGRRPWDLHGAAVLLGGEGQKCKDYCDFTSTTFKIH